MNRLCLDVFFGCSLGQLDQSSAVSLYWFGPTVTVDKDAHDVVMSLFMQQWAYVTPDNGLYNGAFHFGMGLVVLIDYSF